MKTYLFPKGRLITRPGAKHPATVIYYCIRWGRCKSDEMKRSLSAKVARQQRMRGFEMWCKSKVKPWPLSKGFTSPVTWTTG